MALLIRYELSWKVWYGSVYESAIFHQCPDFHGLACFRENVAYALGS